MVFKKVIIFAMFIPGNLWSNPSYRVSFLCLVKGAASRKGRLTILLVSLTADSDDLFAGCKDS